MIEKPKTVKNCRYCEIKLTDTQLKRSAKFCSIRCAADYKSRKFGMTHPNYGALNKSNRTIDRNWQKSVRERDNYTCRRCGKYEKYIHTHHVSNRKQRPDLRWELSNGICLCGSCHSWVHNHPTDAKKEGLISSESYELGILKSRRELQDKMNKRRSANNKALACVVCGKERLHKPSELRDLKLFPYTCISCLGKNRPKDNKGRYFSVNQKGVL